MGIMPIGEVTVIGSGVMGAAIAAHLANAGIRVRLLDMVAKLTLTSILVFFDSAALVVGLLVVGAYVIVILWVQPCE